MNSLSEFSDGNYLQTSEGSIFVHTMGEGLPLVVVHGGPGLEHTYLVEWLRPLSKYRTLVFYDQCGCGHDKTPVSQVSASAMVDQLSNLIKALNLDEGVGIFSHSWGAYIVLSLLQNNSSIRVNELILSNPMALTLERCDESGQRLISRIPDEVQQKIAQLICSESDPSGVKVIEALLPYYVASPSSVPSLEFASYNSTVYDNVFESLGAFDLRNASYSLPKKTLLIYGKNDFETQEGSQELHALGIQVLSMSKTGHFPFAENPHEFIDAIISFLQI